MSSTDGSGGGDGSGAGGAAWARKTDADGRTYFYNAETKESRWDDPSAPSTSDWQVLEDDATGDKYYHNKKTDESRWDPPPELKNVPMASPSKGTASTRPKSARSESPSPSREPVASGSVDSPLSSPKTRTMASRAVRRMSMLPDSTKASARRSILAAAKKVRDAEASGAPGTLGTPGAGPSLNAEATARVAGKLGRWRARAKPTAGAISGGVNLDGGKGLPVRETLQAMYKINRDKTLRDAIIFSAWALLFVLIIFAVNNVHLIYSTNDALIDLFLDEEFSDANYKKNFHEIMTQGELWTFLQGPVFEGLYPDSWYNNDTFNRNETGYLLSYFRLIGGAQLRQARVSRNSCSERRFLDDCLDNAQGVCVPRFDTKDGSCYSEFTISKQDTEPFGPEDQYTFVNNLTSLTGLYNFGPAYGTGGYAVDLGLDRDLAEAKLNELFTNRWTDQGTRLVAVEFNLYNTNTKLLSAVRILVEFFMSGHVVRSFKFFSAKLVVYQSRIDTIRLVGEIMFCVFFLYYGRKEIRTMLVHKPFFMYFTKPNNIFEIIFLSFYLALIISWLLFITDDNKRNFTVNAVGFVDNFPLTEKFMNVFTVAGFIGLASCLKIFKFMSISKKMNALWLTLSRAAPDLIAFIVGFVVLVAGFAFMASMLFGFMLVDFHNFLASFSTLLRFPLGDFNYQVLQIARPALTGIFFTMYVGMVFLVCMNMIIGIVTKYFDEVHHELKYQDKWKISTLSLEAHIMQRMARCCRKTKQSSRKCCRKSNKDSLVTAEDLERQQVQQRQGFSDDLQSEGWAREAQFEEKLHNLMRSAKRKKNVDMFSYFDKVYTGQPNKTLYMGVHELCQLVNKNPCEVSRHTLKECPARQLLEAYNRVKTVTIVGSIARHQPQASKVITEACRRYPIVKVNRSGLGQKRVLVVDTQTKQLFNFNSNMALKKQLPLKQVVQIEKSLTDPARLAIMFTSTGMPYTGPSSLDALETTYDIIFDEGEEARNAFALEIQTQLAAMYNPRDMPDLSMSNPLHLNKSRRQVRAEASVKGVNPHVESKALPESDPGAGAGAASGAGAGGGASGGGAVAAAGTAAAAAAAAASNTHAAGASIAQMGVIAEHMRSQRAAIRMLLEGVSQLRAEVSRFAP